MCASGVKKECYPHGVYFVSLAVLVFNNFSNNVLNALWLLQ